MELVDTTTIDFGMQQRVSSCNIIFLSIIIIGSNNIIGSSSNSNSMATTFRMPAAAGWIKREEEELPDSLATVDTTRPIKSR
mmetsp:Transcript_34915/g.39215  ORF Transcript_34915/g.39215 Transcript_34915/m.39215 type:complete len:82 (+) Transcript_34915:67-312(+)